jgi:hypothetical protein
MPELQRFQQLQGDRSTIRLLPIYSPSGSGKSSLARAGLIPTLGKKPLLGCDRARVVVLRDLQINKLPVILENREQEEPFLAQTL